jgi:hypothetical protein
MSIEGSVVQWYAELLYCRTAHLWDLGSDFLSLVWPQIMPKALRAPRNEEAKVKINKKAKGFPTTATIASTYVSRYRFGISDSTPASASTSTASLETLIATLPVLPDRVSSFDLGLVFTVPMTARMTAQHPTYANTFAGATQEWKVVNVSERSGTESGVRTRAPRKREVISYEHLL